MGSGSRSANELTRLAYIQLEKGNAQKAIDLFENATERAKDERDAKTMLSCYLNAGACLVSKGELKRGTKFLQYASKLVKGGKLDDMDKSAHHSTTDTNLIEASADVHYNLAVAAQGMDDYKRTVSHFKTSISLYLKAGSIHYAADTFTCLAESHRKMADSEKEIACLESAQLLYHESGDSYHEAGACIKLARTYLRDGKIQEYKQMLSKARMLSLRIDDQKLQGELFSQFGLLYISMGLFDLGIEHFERALPLVRKGKETDSSSQLELEASILQNIGAAYNEKSLFMEAIVYHQEAIVLHGQVKNYDAECKCLCNLAFAQTQLNKLQEAAKTFNNALAKSYQTKNHYLQFQAHEGLGSVSLQMGKYGEAVDYFNQGLIILDQIREDSGIARERVMEKLSEASEALQQLKVKQAEDEDIMDEESRSGRTKEPISGNPIHDQFSINSSNAHGGSLTRSQSMPHHSMTRSPSTELDNVSPLKDKPSHSKIPPITERRGVGMLPRIKIVNPKYPVHKHAFLKKKDKLPQTDRDLDTSYNSELQAYMNSYIDSSSSSPGSSPPLHKDSLDIHQGGKFSPLSTSPQKQDDNNEGKYRSNARVKQIPSSLSQQHYIREGCLAIGPDAREKYTIELVKDTEGKRGRKHRHRMRSEIVSTSSGTTPNSTTQFVSKAELITTQESTQGKHHSVNEDLNTTQQSEVCQRPKGQPVNQQSKICTIL